MTTDKLVPPNHWIKATERQKSDTLSGTIKRFKENWGIIETPDHGDFYFGLTNLTKSSRRKKITEGMSVRFKVFKEPNAAGENFAERNGKATDVELR